MRIYCVNFLILSFPLFSLQAFGQMGDNEGELQPDLPEHIFNMESPVLTPSEAISSFQVPDGFRIELVASEPLIEDPVAATFAPDGSLWVIEMQSFMPDVDGNNEDEPISRVVTLRDQDGDGLMDKSTVFLDNLILPRAIAMSHEGILLIAPPNLLYCRDISGDGVCDDIQLLTDGFGGLDSIEHAGNGMLYGIDNVFHNSQHEYSFKFDGEVLESIKVPSHGQWGISQDDFGRHYYSPNSYPILVDEIPKHYGIQGSTKTNLDGIYKGIVSDKRVYPIRPTPGINRGYQNGRLDENFMMKVFDAACSPLVYRDNLYGADFESSVFVCEPAGNLISRYNIVENEHHNLKAIPAYNQSEFIASTDERFRPVNLTLGPDGAIYIADMYRGIVQHRMFVTSFLRKQILARGLDKPIGMGRIWRIVPEDKKLRSVADLSTIEPVALAEHIGHANGTVRDQAQRLLVERSESKVVPVIYNIAKTSDRARDRIKALWTLDGMGSLTKEMVLHALNDSDSMVRVHALRLAEQWRNDKEINSAFDEKSSDSNSLVRRQVALSSSDKYGPDGIDFLLKIAQENPDRTMHSTVFASLINRERELLDRIMINKALHDDNEINRELLKTLIAKLVAARDQITNASIIEFIGKQANQKVWQSEVAMKVVADFIEKSNHQFKLSREPRRWLNLFSESDVLSELTQNANEMIWWQGRTNIIESIQIASSDADLKLQMRGKKVYNICKTCHQVDGRGLAPTYPSLIESDYVVGEPSRLIKILLHGITGPMTRNGLHYDEYMPPAPVKNDYDIAAVATYIRKAWGNNASAINPSEVSKLRQEYLKRRQPWTAEELKN